jgi:hypothetical protein
MAEWFSNIPAEELEDYARSLEGRELLLAPHVTMPSYPSHDFRYAGSTPAYNGGPFVPDPTLSTVPPQQVQTPQPQFVFENGLARQNMQTSNSFTPQPIKIPQTQFIFKNGSTERGGPASNEFFSIPAHLTWPDSLTINHDDNFVYRDQGGKDALPTPKSKYPGEAIIFNNEQCVATFPVDLEDSVADAKPLREILPHRSVGFEEEYVWGRLPTEAFFSKKIKTLEEGGGGEVGLRHNLKITAFQTNRNTSSIIDIALINSNIDAALINARRATEITARKLAENRPLPSSIHSIVLNQVLVLRHLDEKSKTQLQGSVQHRASRSEYMAEWFSTLGWTHWTYLPLGRRRDHLVEMYQSANQRDCPVETRAAIRSLAPTLRDAPSVDTFIFGDDNEDERAYTHFEDKIELLCKVHNVLLKAVFEGGYVPQDERAETDLFYEFNELLEANIGLNEKMELMTKLLLSSRH